MTNMGRDLKNFARWEKENLRRFALKLNRKTEADVIEHLEKQSNIRQYLIDIIRQDIKKEG